MLELLLYFAIGIAVMRLGLLKDFHTLARLVFYVCLPAAILSNIPPPGLVVDIPSIVFLVALPMLLVGVAVNLLYSLHKISSDSFGLILISSVFGNIVYLGIPISRAYLPGTIGVMSLFIILTNFILFVFIVPVATLKHKGNSILANPVLISAVLAFALLFFGIDTSALAVLEPLASMTVPLSLIAMGVFAAHHLQLSFGRDVQYIILFKHVALPVATLLCIFILSPGKAIADMAMIAAIMSPAIANFSIIDSLKIDKEREVASAIILGIPIMMIELWLLFGFRA